MKTYGEIFEIPCWARVEFHPYRTATPKLVMMSLKQDSEAGKELEATLMEKAKEWSKIPNAIQKDNHICFSFSNFATTAADETKLVVMISDGEISIGVGLVRERW